MAHDREAASRAKEDKDHALAAARRRAMLRKAQGAAIVVALVGALGFILLQRSGDGPASGGTAGPGQPAPAIEMTDFEGERFRLSDYEGTPVVLNFWASWCPNCIAEMPDFERVYQANKGDVEFLGVNQRDQRRAADELAAETGVTYRLSEDPSGEVFDSFLSLGMPTTVFIGADGNIVDVVTGQLNETQLQDYITRSFGTGTER